MAELITGGGGGASGTDLSTSLGPSQILTYSDFLNSGDTTFATINSGTGSSVSINGNAGDSYHTHPGVAICSTGTTASGYAGVYLSPNYFNMGGGTITMEAVIRLPVLSDGTQWFQAHFGILNGFTSSSKSCWMRYDHSVNSGNWELINEGAGVESAVNAAVGPAANTWTKLGIVINAGATSAEFFVDDNSVGTNTAALPGTTAADICGFRCYIRKIGGTTGRTLEIDYMKFLVDLTTER